MKALAAEMTANFSKRLASLGVSVRELTGDMQLTKKEIANTQVGTSDWSYMKYFICQSVDTCVINCIQGKISKEQFFVG